MLLCMDINYPKRRQKTARRKRYKYKQMMIIVFTSIPFLFVIYTLVHNSQGEPTNSPTLFTMVETTKLVKVLPSTRSAIHGEYSR